MRALPTGTVTFLFTDIEGSTRLLQELGSDRYDRVQDEHAAILRLAIEAGEGVEIRTEGDSFFAVFPTPAGALRAAVAAQRDLAAHPWPEGATISVRIGLHTGEGRLGGDDYVGIDVNRAARIAGAGHGGQVLISDATRGLVEHDLPDGVRVRDLGDHRLKDIAHPEQLFDLVIDGLPTDFPSLKTLDARPNNLPLQLTSFIGRDAEINEIVRLLDEHRLVTLTGPGGTGKTRLALAVATEVLPRFGDGAFFVDLAPIADPGQVCPAICQALEVREEPGSEVIDTMVNRLAGRELLLLLDNFEHLLEAAPLVDDVMGRVAEVSVLVTSRAPLSLYGEQEHDVPPLALPDPDHLPEPEALSRYEAVELFVERARTAKPNFEITQNNAPAVAEICARLDGLPLAIELAASRIKILSPAAILARLEHRLELLTASARNLPERQRTLRGAIEWSYELLDEPERRLIARLSVFSGGADLHAAEAVANPDGDLGMEILDGLASLLDNSLLRQIETASEEPRFGLLETIREYAGERLDAEFDAEATRRRHAEHFMALAEEAEPHFLAEDAPEWLDRIDLEHDNLLEALGWAVEAGEAERGMQAGASLWRFWQMRGQLAVGRLWLDRLLAVPGGRTPARAKAHSAAGSVAYWQADAEDTERHYREALAIYRELGDRPGIAQATYDLAFVPVTRGTGFEESGRLLQSAIDLFQEVGDEDGAARAKGDLGFFLMMTGDPRASLPLMEESLSRSRDRGDMIRVMDDSLRVAEAYRILGRHDDARRGQLESLAIAERAGIPGGIAAVLQIMASVEMDQNRHVRAMRLFGAGEAIAEPLEGGFESTPFHFADPVGEARRAIGDEATDHALGEGRAMSREEAVAYARSSED
ncbi:MAG: adenylate/guanylate cyclase domain-containing protein [Actinomycetota bacterium]